MGLISGTNFSSIFIAGAISLLSIGSALADKKTTALFPAWEEDDRGYGFIDASGKWVIEPQFEKDSESRAAGYYSSFINGLAPVKKGGKFGLINSDGKFLIRPTFKDLGNASEGRLAASTGKLYGYVDLKGDWIIKPQFSWAYSFSGGLASVVTEDGRRGLIDLDGKLVIELPKYHSPMWAPMGTWNAIEIMDPETTESTAFYFINRDGEKLNGKTYTGATPFVDGLAAIEENGKWGFIDESGKYRIGAKFLGARPFSDNGLAAAAIRNDDGKKVWGFINKEGNWGLPPVYEAALGFSEGIGVVWHGEGWRYIDRQGKVVFENSDRDPIFFDHGLARIFVDTDNAKGALTYIDTSGEVVWQQAAASWVKQLQEVQIARRVEACRKLGEIAKPDSVAPLAHAVTTDPVTEVREEAAEALGRIKSKDAIPALSKALKDEYSSVRRRAAAAMKEIADPKTGPVLLEALEKEASSFASSLMAEALGVIQYQPATATIIKALTTESDDFARGRAAISLGEMGNKAAVEPLIAALDDEDGDVRSHVARALGQLEDPRAIDPLIKRIDDPYPHAQRAVIEALGKMKDPKVIDLLIPLLKHKDMWVRFNSISALGALKAEKAIPDLIGILGESDFIAVRFAATSLNQITGEKFESDDQPDEEKWQQWWTAKTDE